jgi:hypothetical protein
MKALLGDALQEMAAEGIPEEGTEVTVIDAAIMYQYSREKGLRPIRLLQPDADGIVHFSDGRAMLAPPESAIWARQRAWPDAGAGLATSYSPYRRVTSLTGYRKVEGYIRQPGQQDFGGVDGREGYPEGAFNYFGLSRAGIVDVEAGICSQWNAMNQDPPYWYVYHSLNGNPWDRDGWPPGGLPPGTQSFMRMWVPADNQVSFYISAAGGGSYTQTYNVTGPRYDGTGQALRRVTSMVVYGSAISRNNGWTNVSIATPSNLHLWRPSDTASAVSTEYVTVQEYNKYYNETVSIDTP